MKGKTFLILLVAAGLLVGLWFLRSADEKDTGMVKMGEKLFADLPVNAVASMTIADAENKVTLVKGDKVWQVKDRDGYPANFDEIRDTVVKLSRLKVGRSFSASPESLTRLSLLAPSASDTSGVGKQVTLKDGSGQLITDIILGQNRETGSGGSGGQYLKKTDSETVFLVDGSFRFLKTDPAQWLNKEILDVSAEEVASVVCYAGDSKKPVYTLSRSKKGEAAQMTPVPPGRTVDAAKVDQVFDALAPLTLDDVRAGDATPAKVESDDIRLVYQLYDGRQISIFPASDGKDSYTLRVMAEDSIAPTQVADEPPASQPADEKTPAGETAAPALKTAQQLNDALRPWVFSLKKWQFDSFITQPEALLEEAKEKGEGTS
jgi:hypothetical protein